MCIYLTSSNGFFSHQRSRKEWHFIFRLYFSTFKIRKFIRFKFYVFYIQTFFSLVRIFPLSILFFFISFLLHFFFIVINDSIIFFSFTTQIILLFYFEWFDNSKIKESLKEKTKIKIHLILQIYVCFILPFYNAHT